MSDMMRTWAVHSSDNVEIGEVEECVCSHGTAPSHYVATVYKDAEGADSYEIGVYDDLEDAEMAVADEYDTLGPFAEDGEEDEEDGPPCPNDGNPMGLDSAPLKSGMGSLYWWHCPGCGGLFTYTHKNPMTGNKE